MGLLARALGLGSREQRSQVTADELADMLADPVTATGRRVPVEKSLQQTTVFACVNLIGETVGTLPLMPFRRLERGKERATSHPTYPLVHDLANPEMTAQELSENMAGHVALWGNAYCEIEYDVSGRRRALWPLRPDMMDVTVNDRNERVYVYTLPNGEPKPLDRWRVWHVRGWGTDAWVGKSRIASAREAIALALATEEQGARFFGNDSRPGGILVHPGKLSNEAAARLKERWESAHRGLDNRQRVAVLEEGIEWKAVGIPPNEAQWLETRGFQDVKICGIFRVPPPMVGILEGSTTWGTGLNEQKAWFKTFAVQPFLTRIAKSAYRDLLWPSERKTYFFEHVTAAYEQADLMTRYNAYKIGRDGGWLSPNDILEMENRNPIENGDGYLQPLNMAPLGSDPSAAAPDGASAQDGGDGDGSQNGNEDGDDDEA